MPLTPEQRQQILEIRREVGVLPTGGMRVFKVTFANGKQAAMLNPDGGNIADAWETCIDRFGRKNIKNVVAQ
ncbi:MAG: hypothetical protein IBX50_04040 [Marinospirillum sp.]|uniref:hypothetical protein n=1 Tax=Marinospirillum sp. TaxID=2183934 RepID=UPI001A077724|nr:hypothetical protein [Marinospirillum sp.]MBE0505876.1 hypothetical protein [Marinospirillum sp.]